MPFNAAAFFQHLNKLKFIKRKRFISSPPFFMHVIRLCMKYMYEKTVKYYLCVYGIIF